MKKSMIAVGVWVGIFAVAGVAFAQTYTPLAPLPIGEGGATPATYTLTTYLSGAIKLLVAIAGALAVLMTIIGGAKYVAAGINPSAKSDAKGDITNALIGLALVLSSYLILRSIDPRLVEFNLALPPVGQIPAAPAATVAPTPTPSTQPTPSRLRSGGTNTSVQSPTVAPNAPATGLTPATHTPSSPAASAQSVLSARINRNNDFSIIGNCIGNTTYDLCPRTDLNGDGQTNMTDLVLFSQRGRTLDINQNNTIEVADAPAAASCFFKTPGVSMQAMLPIEVPSDSGVATPCGGSGRTIPPNTQCNGGTWVTESALASRCAVDSGLSAMPFGYVYGGGSGFTQFESWVRGSAQGSAVNLSDLFVKTFFRQVSSGDSTQIEYTESDVGKITYATIAAYDLNNDGVADFSTGGADRAAFDACRGQAASGRCAQADFNGDGVIDDRDLGFINFMQSNVFGGSGFIPLRWKLNWFESMLFDPTGYTDKQILLYCLDRDAFEKCARADLNGDRKVDNADFTMFNALAPQLDFNGDRKVDLQ